MPVFHLHIVNSDFESANQIEAPDFEKARRQALRAALAIGADEVCKGTTFFGAEVRVESDGKTERFMIGMGQSPLK